MYGGWPIPIGSSQRTAYIARPDAAGRFPVVLVLPTLDGLSGFEKDVCRALARSGLAAIAIDFYRQAGDPLEAYEALSDARAMTDIDEAREFIVSDDVDWAVDGDIGILGVDVGGRFGLVAAATRPWVGALVVAYTPLTGDEERGHQVADYLGHLPVPVLGLYGADDELIDVGTVDEAQRRNGHGQWVLYEGAGHDFLDVGADLYDADASADAMVRIIDFLRSTLPQAIELDLG
jgi:carboxymethylenebutenolidase